MFWGGLRWLSVAVLSLGLIGCGRIIPEGRLPPVAVTPAANALSAGFAPGPAVTKLGLRRDDARGALLSFRASCTRLTSRSDGSGLTADWKPACTAATQWPESEAVQFFSSWFETARIGDGKAFVTGYYEPEIAGVRTRRPGYDVPVFALPPDLVRARQGDAPPNPNGSQPLGRDDQDGRVAPYFDRGEIEVR